MTLRFTLFLPNSGIVFMASSYKTYIHCIRFILYIYPHAFFLKKRRGYCNRLHLSVPLSVMLSPPKPLDEIQPNLV